VSAPKVLGFSLEQLEQRLAALEWIQPDRQLLAQVCWLAYWWLQQQKSLTTHGFRDRLIVESRQSCADLSCMYLLPLCWTTVFFAGGA
jgi:hypothetical protein